MGMLLTHALNCFRRRLPPRQDKEEWEFRWQRDTWAKDFARPENQQKVLEYWRTHRHLDEILERVRPTAETRILDVGCGISTVLHYLPGERFGVDPLAQLAAGAMQPGSWSMAQLSTVPMKTLLRRILMPGMSTQ